MAGAERTGQGMTRANRNAGISNRRVMFRAILFVTAMLLSVTTAQMAIAGTILYVDDDAPPGGDGLTWDTAFRFMQDGLAGADGTDGARGETEIHVGQGMYQPDRDEANPTGTGDREATFQLKNSVALIGGYAGIGAPDPDDRDIDAYETILSGDLLGDDGPEFENYGENSYHVVTGSGTDATAILDGLVIGSGFASVSSDPRQYGGGMLNVEGSPTLEQCTFKLNWAYRGGGMRNEGASPSLIQCTFDSNFGLYHGGGMSNYLYSDPALTGCAFLGNRSEGDGGGMFNLYACSTIITDCILIGNSSLELRGGAITNFENFGAIATRCTFFANSAWSGGAVCNFYGDMTMANCVFTYNLASRGGAVSNDSSSDPVMIDCILRGNSATKGGAINNADFSRPIIVNCKIADNSALDFGGGFYNQENADPYIVNCTVSENSALMGGGIYSIYSSSATVVNSVLWENRPNQITDDSYSPTIVTHCDVQYGWEGEGNIDADPLFIDPDNDDYRLSAGSPCIDAGDNGEVPEDVTTDLDGNPRFVDDPDTEDTGLGDPPIVDMGCYEFQPPECPGALNGDGTVDVLDLIAVLGAWGPCPDCEEDINGDGVVDVLDLLEALSAWGPCE